MMDELTLDSFKEVIIIISAFILLGYGMSVVSGKLTDGTTAVAVFSALTAVIGTIIGAIFGVHAGSQGKQDAVNTALLVDPKFIDQEEVLENLKVPIRKE